MEKLESKKKVKFINLLLLFADASAASVVFTIFRQLLDVTQDSRKFQNSTNFLETFFSLLVVFPFCFYFIIIFFFLLFLFLYEHTDTLTLEKFSQIEFKWSEIPL